MNESEKNSSSFVLTPDMPPPDFLDIYGKELWRRLVADVSAVRGADGGAYTTLTLACDAYSEFRHAKKEVDKQGITYMTSDGNVKAHPAVAIQRNACKQLHAYLAELGMTPASKKKIVAAKQTDEDPASKYFD